MGYLRFLFAALSALFGFHAATPAGAAEFWVDKASAEELAKRISVETVKDTDGKTVISTANIQSTPPKQKKGAPPVSADWLYDTAWIVATLPAVGGDPEYELQWRDDAGGTTVLFDRFKIKIADLAEQDGPPPLTDISKSCAEGYTATENQYPYGYNLPVVGGLTQSRYAAGCSGSVLYRWRISLDVLRYLSENTAAGQKAALWLTLQASKGAPPKHERKFRFYGTEVSALLTKVRRQFDQKPGTVATRSGLND